MLARCARCQGTFTTDRFGRQYCPHCGSELDLADPNAPRPPPAPEGAGEPPPGPPAPPAGAQPPPGGELPPPPPPPPGGYGPPGGYVPPGYGPPGGYGYGGPGGPGFPPPPPGGWGPPPGGPPFQPEVPAPFAERATRGWFSSFFETWKLVATEPQQFFRRVRIDQVGSAILFGLIAYVLGAALEGAYGAVSMHQTLAAMDRSVRDLPPEAAEVVRRFMQLFGGKFVLLQVVAAPLWGIVRIYLLAGVLHLLLSLFGGAPRPFDATLTAVGYAHGLYLLQAIPGCGGIVALVWFIVVLVGGLAEIQRCGTGKALGAVVTTALLWCLCLCAGGLAMMGRIMALVQDHGTTHI